MLGGLRNWVQDLGRRKLVVWIYAEEWGRVGSRVQGLGFGMCFLHCSYLRNFQVGSYRYRSLMEGLYTL